MAATFALVNLLQEQLKDQKRFAQYLRHDVKQLKEEIADLKHKLWVQTHCACKPPPRSVSDILIASQAFEILQLKSVIAKLANEKVQMYDRPDAALS